MVAQPFVNSYDLMTRKTQVFKYNTDSNNNNNNWEYKLARSVYFGQFN